MLRLALLATVLLLATTPSPARAQRPDPLPPDHLAILHDPEHQQELGLSTEQSQAVEDLWRDWNKGAEAFGDEHYWRNRLNAHREYSRRALELLDEPQRGPFLRMVLRRELDRRSTPLFWIRHPQSRTELRLTAEQQAGIEKLQNEWVVWRAFPALKDLEPTGPPHRPWSTPEVHARRAELEREFQPRMDYELERILTADQRRRFDEITLQVETRSLGPSIFHHARVAPEMHFSVEQQERLADLVAEVRTQNAANPRGRIEREREGIREIVSSILTPEQQRRWKELLGEPLPWTGATLLQGEPPPRQ